MFDLIRRQTLRLLKVPAEPHPPAGSPGSLRVFRAGRHFYHLRLASWALAQAVALAGIVFWTVMLLDVEHGVLAERAKRAAAVAPTSGPGADPTTASTPGFQERVQKSADDFKKAVDAEGRARRASNRVRGFGPFDAFREGLVSFARQLPPGIFPLVRLLKIAGFTLYLLQIPITYAVRRLDFEMRWYMVTDRSLRLRHGVWKVSESTMSFANVQQVTVMQNPLQRLLGLSDVRVQSAGGGSGSSDSEHATQGEDMHVGLFHGVTNAAEIRDLILDRLKRFRESGLGDPDETVAPLRREGAASAPVSVRHPEAVAAAREVLEETRRLRRALG